MINYKEDNEYLTLIDNIINNEKFKSLDNISHHNTTRLDHSLNVSYKSYKMAKKLKLDYVSVARAGLLHDFYLDEVNNCDKFKDKFKLFTSKHPKDALNNSKELFSLSEKEQDIIVSHMFPMNLKMPKYKESWLVDIVDDYVSIGDFSKKFRNEIRYASNFLLILALNLIIK